MCNTKTITHTAVGPTSVQERHGHKQLTSHPLQENHQPAPKTLQSTHAPNQHTLSSYSLAMSLFTRHIPSENNSSLPNKLHTLLCGKKQPGHPPRFQHVEWDVPWFHCCCRRHQPGANKARSAHWQQHSQQLHVACAPQALYTSSIHLGRSQHGYMRTGMVVQALCHPTNNSGTLQTTV